MGGSEIFDADDARRHDAVASELRKPGQGSRNRRLAANEETKTAVGEDCLGEDVVSDRTLTGIAQPALPEKAPEPRPVRPRSRSIRDKD